jgi:NADH-quinone oxidoreductase subunit J
MDAQFLSAIQVTVYVGGIVVLIVFVILLVADVTQKVFLDSPSWRKGVTGLVCLVLFALLATAMHSFDFGPVAGVTPRSASVEQIGHALLSPNSGGFILPFEVVSLVLIAALIGAVTVARSEEPAPGDQEKKS